MNRRMFFLSGASAFAVAHSSQSVSAQQMEKTARMPQTFIHYIEADGVRLFYRESGAPSAPVILFLHGFPASSFQYRELLALLAGRSRVIAPDFPGFGFTEVPEERRYEYTFEALTNTTIAFAEVLGLKRYAMYLFDYGAPVGFRMALVHPERVTAIISQNGNVYEEGLGPTWATIRRYWNDPSAANRQALQPIFTAEAIRHQYVDGTEQPEAVAPEGYTLDSALIERRGNKDIQADLFLDYQNNVRLYPKFQQYLRTSKPRLLAIWGKNDQHFIPAGAEAFRRDLPSVKIQLLDTGHFATATHSYEIAASISAFLQ